MKIFKHKWACVGALIEKLERKQKATKYNERTMVFCIQLPHTHNFNMKLVELWGTSGVDPGFQVRGGGVSFRWSAITRRHILGGGGLDIAFVVVQF